MSPLLCRLQRLAALSPWRLAHACGRFDAMPRALIVGGTGLIGRATARRLLAAGWQVDLTGRDPAHLPADIAASGGTFVAGRARRPGSAPRALLATAPTCSSTASATPPMTRRALLPLAHNAGSTVMISSKAVYVDGSGHHSNSETAPHFDGPIRETQPTMAPGDADYNSRGLRREQSRGRAGPARQRRTGHRSPSLQDPRRRRKPAARVGLRQARARPASRRLPRPPRRRGRPPDRRREHRRAHRGGRGDTRVGGS